MAHSKQYIGCKYLTQLTDFSKLLNPEYMGCGKGRSVVMGLFSPNELHCYLLTHSFTKSCVPIAHLPPILDTSLIVFSEFCLPTEPSLRTLVSRILPLCGHYSQLTRFVESRSRYNHGLVNHALSAAITSLIKDYMVREHRCLTNVLNTTVRNYIGH